MTFNHDIFLDGSEDIRNIWSIRKEIDLQLNESKQKKETVLEIGPADRPYAKIIIRERRTDQKDRRKIHTYISDDRRSGIADRRKGPKEQ
jgi:hypothetical protein